MPFLLYLVRVTATAASTLKAPGDLDRVGEGFDSRWGDLQKLLRGDEWDLVNRLAAEGTAASSLDLQPFSQQTHALASQMVSEFLSCDLGDRWLEASPLAQMRHFQRWLTGTNASSETAATVEFKGYCHLGLLLPLWL